MSKLTRSNDHTAKFYGFSVDVMSILDTRDTSGGWTWAVLINAIEHHVTLPYHQDANAAYAEALRTMVAMCENMAAQARTELAEIGG